MTAVLRVTRLLLGAAPWAMARGGALAAVVLLMGAALLGLSGWFITATGLAGLAGIGIAFDVFRPSAGVRFLALGRTAARYGERLLTHNATLRALAALRVDLLRRQAGRGARDLGRLRSEGVLTRIVSDVDALDGLVLRLLLPVIAGIITLAVVFAALYWLAGPLVATVILVGYVPPAAIVLGYLARRGLRPSARAERVGQDLRRGVIDTIRDREALILAGQLAKNEDRLIAADGAARQAACELDRAERDAGLALSLVVTLVAAAAFLAGGWHLAGGDASAAIAVIGLFVALALAETLLPLRRGFADLGRMVDAASRVAPSGERGVARTAVPEAVSAHRTAALLSVDTPGASFRLRTGKAIALTGPSGSGKTTLLTQIAGLEDGPGIQIDGIAPSDYPEELLRSRVSMLPQRSALIAGTVRENLALAGDADDVAMWAVLDHVDLAATIRERGGLDARLGEGGAGLSGGQTRRLALARTLLRCPALLLLDEPTEGLDHDTADRVLNGIRRALPDAAIVAAIHRGSNHPVFERIVALGE